MTAKHHPSNLDTDKLRKVAALINAGATEGERASARNRASAIAAKAGLSLEDALSKLDAPTNPKPKGFFDGFEDWMEEKEPGYRAERAAERDAREQRKADRRAELIARMGSIKAVFDPTPWEAALFAAVDPISICESTDDPSGTIRQFTTHLNGKSEVAWDPDQMDPLVRVLVERAYPMPSTLDGLLAEIRAWDQLRHDRQAFVSYEWNNALEVDARVNLIEHLLNTKPAQSWDDMQARFAWKRFEFERQWLDPTEREDPFMERIEEDFAFLRGHDAPADAQSARRTNADKRNAVLSILDASPELSDREISRRVGVSPQTVNNWRRNRAAA